MPDSINRWDKPLFTVNSFDELPLAQISDAILLAKAPTPNIATKLVGFLFVFSKFPFL